MKVRIAFGVQVNTPTSLPITNLDGRVLLVLRREVCADLTFIAFRCWSDPLAQDSIFINLFGSVLPKLALSPPKLFGYLGNGSVESEVNVPVARFSALHRQACTEIGAALKVRHVGPSSQDGVLHQIVGPGRIVGQREGKSSYVRK